MMRIVKERWAEAEKSIRQDLKSEHWMNIDIQYKDLLHLVIDKIFVGKYNASARWLTVVNDGSVSGTLIFIIPTVDHKLDPSRFDYMMTAIDYGSCLACDALENAKSYFNSDKNKMIDLLVSICKEMAIGLFMPYRDKIKPDDYYFADGIYRKNEFDQV